MRGHLSRLRITLRGAVFTTLLAGSGLLVIACDGALDPQGPQAERISDLAWILFVTAFVIFALVMAILVRALVRRPRPEDNEARDRALLIGGGGLVLPAIVLFAVIGLTVDALDDLSQPAPDDALQINITGYEFWWDVVYPDADVRTANEIHMPAGETVSVTGTSVDVIHSFWSPQINGKMDFVPGKDLTFKLHADEPGIYRGQCAEFCGVGHTKMAFFLIVQPRDEFDAWLEEQGQPPAGLQSSDTEAGRLLFFRNSCGVCHGLSGSASYDPVAPDLAHLASRDTMVSGTLPVSEASLRRWLSDPEAVKPGVNMPAYDDLSDEDMQALVRFLLSLE